MLGTTKPSSLSYSERSRSAPAGGLSSRSRTTGSIDFSMPRAGRPIRAARKSLSGSTRRSSTTHARTTCATASHRCSCTGALRGLRRPPTRPGARLTLGTYGHVIDALDDRPQQDAETQSSLPDRAGLPIGCPSRAARQLLVANFRHETSRCTRLPQSRGGDSNPGPLHYE